jgi:ribosomal protein L17
MAHERKLGRTASQRKAMLRNLTTNLLWYGRIETTEAKAKEVRSIVDKMITLAINNYDKTVEVEKEFNNGNFNGKVTLKEMTFGTAGDYLKTWTDHLDPASPYHYGKVTVDGLGTYPVDDVTAAPDMYELHYNEDPFHIESKYAPAKMPENGSSMVPRVFKTNVGDIFTTNTINGTVDTIKTGVILTPGASGILEVAAEGATGMLWQVVKVYTMPDHQRGVKVMRIA